MNRISAAGLALLVSLGLLAAPALAQTKQPAQQKQAPAQQQPKQEKPQDKAKVIGQFGDWQALTYKDGSADACYVASAPKKSEGHTSKPGETNILVTHWPSQKTFGVVSVSAGYDYQKDSKVELAVGNEKFSLFTKGSHGWANDGDDTKIVKAFKSAKSLTASGVSTKGTKTKDFYSLDGFGKAYEAASKACGVKD